MKYGISGLKCIAEKIGFRLRLNQHDLFKIFKLGMDCGWSDVFARILALRIEFQSSIPSWACYNLGMKKYFLAALVFASLHVTAENQKIVGTGATCVDGSGDGILRIEEKKKITPELRKAPYNKFHPFNEEIATPPLVMSDGTVVVGTTWGTLMFYTTGGILKNTVYLDHGAFQSPIVKLPDGTELISTVRNGFFQIRSDGFVKPLYEVPTSGVRAPTSPVSTKDGFLLRGGTSFQKISSKDGKKEMEIEDGFLRYNFSTPVVLKDGTIVVGQTFKKKSTAEFIDTSGDKKSISIEGDVLGATALENGTVIVATQQGELNFFDSKASSIRTPIKIGKNLAREPTILKDGTIVVVTIKPARIIFLDSDGKIKSEHNLEESVPGNPVELADGSIALPGQMKTVRLFNPDGSEKAIYAPRWEGGDNYRPAALKDGGIVATNSFDIIFLSVQKNKPHKDKTAAPCSIADPVTPPSGHEALK